MELSASMIGWTVRDAMEEATSRLANKNVTEPDYSAMYLMAASLRLPWDRGIRDLHSASVDSDGLLSTTLTTEQASELEEMLKRREQHEPIQYVLGQWDFLDYTVAIREPLLCPRPETEELVTMVAEEIRAPHDSSPVRILDVGCGTGVIGISLAKLFRDATVEAIDVEPVAIAVSTENAQRILLEDSRDNSQRDCDRYRARLVSAGDYKTDKLFDVVVSNPPYIPRTDMAGLTKDVKGFESDQALCGGIDGMDVIKTIIDQLPKWCKRGAVCWMEVDPTHPQLIEELLPESIEGENQDDEKLHGSKVCFDSFYKDMFGKDRFVKLRVV